MRELYALTYDYWTLPISVEYPDEQEEVALVKVGFGIPILQCQRAAAAKALDLIGRRITPSKWAVPKVNLLTIAEPVNGDPEMVVNWKPFNGRVNMNGEKAISRMGDEFFVEFVRRGVIKDVATAKILWKAFCLHCIHWLVNKQEVVDMLFCKLTPLPYRPNWKHFVLNEELKLQKKKSIVPKWENRAVAAMTSTAPFPLKSPKILWFNPKERLIHWTLDVKPTKLFYRMVAEREAIRKHRLHAGYFFEIVYDLKKALPRALKIYAAFLREISRPGVEYRGFKRFKRKDKPLKDGRLNHPCPPPEVNIAPIAFSSGDGKERPNAFFTEVEEASFVREMSRVQPPVQDLRDTSGQNGQ